MKILLITFFFSTSVNAIDWEKCAQFRRKSTPFGLLASTSSFFTSTGDCSMIGQISYDKKVFLVNNADPLRIDISRGSGEYLDAYAIISGCDLKTREYLPVLLQKNYVEIWGVEEKDTKAVYDSLEKIMNNDPKIKNGCNSRSNT